MARRSTKKIIPAFAAPVAGNFVLIGGTRASYPGDWYHGFVLWADNRNAMIERSTQNGETWREACSTADIRACGTLAHLIDVQRRAREGVASIQLAVHEAEYALGVARAALWKQLDDLASDGLLVFPPDFERIEDVNAKELAAHDQYYAEAEAVAP